MTDVAFHLHVGDRAAYACRMLRKAYLKGARLLVLTDSEELDRLDRALWLMAPGEFVPHARESDSPWVLRYSPILMATQEVGGFPANVLVNLGAAPPSLPGRFDRVIEIVGNGADDRQMARERWRYYKAAGFEPHAHDLAQGAEH